LEIPIKLMEETLPYKAPVAAPHLVPPKHEHYGGEVRMPSADIIDGGEWYKVIVDLPGVQANRIKIHLSKKAVEICSELEVTSEEKGLKYICRERCYSNLCRYINFPEEVIAEEARAFLHNGVLEVNVPKKRRIKKVKAYTLSTCPYCKRLKQLLKELGVEFEFIDVDLLTREKRNQVLEEVKKLNPSLSFPTVIIGEKIIIGFREAEIKEALSERNKGDFK
jgi:HSP20 family molecular chaperone IbpA/glutaredoxin